MSVWFITGCSSGFGIGLARLALHAGHKVIATSRNPPKTPSLVHEIEALGGTWLQLDVCSPELSHVLDKALSIYGKIDVLVNNAGSSILGPVEDISDAEARSMMEVNFFAPLNIIRHVVPHMRERRSGTIINISSTAGIVAVPTAGIYAASKHALEGL
jgi:NADP-dependent 3-hydroxy acid dehydrogenase YdfG